MRVCMSAYMLACLHLCRQTGSDVLGLSVHAYTDTYAHVSTHVHTEKHRVRCVAPEPVNAERDRAREEESLLNYCW